MWSYYGSKFKVAKFYPLPKYDLIIEPFAGSAWYSVLHRSKDVLLNEKYDVVFGIWNWLIKNATSEEISSNNEFYAGQDIRLIVPDLPKPHRDLIGFCINQGCGNPRNIVQKGCAGLNLDQIGRVTLLIN